MKATLVYIAMVTLRVALYIDLCWIGWNLVCKLLLDAPFNWWSLMPIPIIVSIYIFMIYRFIEEFTEELNEPVEELSE